MNIEPEKRNVGSNISHMRHTLYPSATPHLIFKTMLRENKRCPQRTNYTESFLKSESSALCKKKKNIIVWNPRKFNHFCLSVFDVLMAIWNVRNVRIWKHPNNLYTGCVWNALIFYLNRALCVSEIL